MYTSHVNDPPCPGTPGTGPGTCPRSGVISKEEKKEPKEPLNFPKAPKELAEPMSTPPKLPGQVPLSPTVEGLVPRAREPHPLGRVLVEQVPVCRREQQGRLWRVASRLVRLRKGRNGLRAVLCIVGHRTVQTGSVRIGTRADTCTHRSYMP